MKSARKRREKKEREKTERVVNVSLFIPPSFFFSP
jgi:hypothetical protein